MKRPSSASLIVFGFSLGLFASANAASLGSSVFSDVSSGAYYDSAVGEMYADGIITGYGNGKFGPNDYVTRGQVAVMMQRFKNGGVVVSSSSSSSRRSTTSSSSSSSSSSTSSSTASATEAGSFRFTTGSYKGDEDEASVTINIIRYGGNTGTVSVDYETENGTANSGSDYEATSGTLTFANGKTAESFQIPLIEDSEKEGNETVIIHLKGPKSGAVLGSPVTATLTIVDNDEGDGTSADPDNNNGVFVLSAAEYEIAENMNEVTITIERKSGSEGTATVKYEATKGTAGNENFDSISATSVTFNAGETTKTFKVTVKDNDSINGNKTVNLKLLAPTGGASLGSLSSSTLIIVDDEVSNFGNGGIHIKEDEYNATEGDPLIITIDRIGGAKGEVSVDYTTQNSLAKAGDDYTEISGTLTFKEGETQKLVTIPILDDNKNDPNETFKLILSNPTGGATLETPASTTVTIN